jgi:hypothetical protein
MDKIDNTSGSNYHLNAETLIFRGCTEFFIGWIEEVWSQSDLLSRSP